MKPDTVVCVCVFFGYSTALRVHGLRYSRSLRPLFSSSHLCPNITSHSWSLHHDSYDSFLLLLWAGWWLYPFQGPPLPRNGTVGIERRWKETAEAEALWWMVAPSSLQPQKWLCLDLSLLPASRSPRRDTGRERVLPGGGVRSEKRQSFRLKEGWSVSPQIIRVLLLFLSPPVKKRSDPSWWASPSPPAVTFSLCGGLSREARRLPAPFLLSVCLPACLRL